MTAYSFETFQDVVDAAGDEITAAKRCVIASVCGALTFAVGSVSAIVVADALCGLALALTGSAFFSLVVAVFVFVLGCMAASAAAQAINDWVLSGQAAAQVQGARIWVKSLFKRDASTHLKQEMARERVNAEAVHTEPQPIVTKERQAARRASNGRFVRDNEVH